MQYELKKLFIGNNTTDTDLKVSIQSDLLQTKNHGLISDSNFIPDKNGFYHTSVTDLSIGEIIKISKYFDEIEMLDQPRDEWTHQKSLLSTFKLMCELEKIGRNTKFRTNKNIIGFGEFEDFLNQNKSFCIYPWINFVMENSKNLQLCARSGLVVTQVDKLQDWVNDKHFNTIRNKMLAGQSMGHACQVCYNYEAIGAESYRQYDTREWLNQLEIKNLSDLKKIENPYYYEIRLSNKCNAMCRGCRPSYSHLIEKEARKFNIVHDKGNFKPAYPSINNINVSTLTNKHRVYLTGGEPTIMSEVLKFMENCIDQNKTDFELTMSTNGEKFSAKFLKLSESFSNMNFSFSLDGYGKINDYWRWGTNWDNIVKNMKLCQRMGHSVQINTVPGIYNVTNLHLLYEFLDKEFPLTTVYLQLNYLEKFNTFNHPNRKLVVESMEKCKQTKVYHSDGKSNKTVIDSIYDYYIKNPTPDISLLKQFFDFNDQLDRARNSKLGDYIPELEACRQYIL